MTTSPEPTLGDTTAASIGAADAPKRFHDFTTASAVVFIFAIATVLTLPSSKIIHAPVKPIPLAVTIPHLSIVALMAAGFRRRGEILAWIVALPLIFILPLLAFLSGLGDGSGGDTVLFKLALFQLIIILAAGADLDRNRKLTPQPIALRNRWIGLLVPVVVLLATAARTNGGAAGHVKEVQFAEDANRAETKRQASAWLSDRMLDDLVRIAQCVERFRGDSIAGPAPKSLREADCPDSIGQHHVVYYAPPKNPRSDPFHRAAFTVGIEAVWDSTEFPDAVGRAATRNYFLDANGEIHVTAERRRATVADAVVPACPRHDGAIPDNVECRPPFESRERWGVVRELPRFAISVDRFNAPDTVLARPYFHQVNALDSVRLVSIDWGEGTAPTVLNIKPTQSLARVVKTPAAVSITEFQPIVFYRYSTTGRKIVTATLLTRGGDHYVARDTVDITWVRTRS